MSVVLISSDVFATQKPVVRTPKDGRDINQKRVLYKTRLFPAYTEVCREKVYTDVHFQNGHGRPWFYAAAMFLQRKNSRPEVYTDVHFRTRLIDKAETVGNGASPFCALIFIFPLDNSYNGKFFHRYH